MLRRDLGVVVEAAKKLGFFIGVSTNGFQIPIRIEELRPVDLVQISYDGPAEVHGYLRGEESVKETNDAIDALLSHNIPIWINTVLTTVNASCLDQIVEFARKRGIAANFVLLDYFTDPQAHFHPSLQAVEDLRLMGRERRQVLQRLIDIKKEGGPVAGSIPYFENALYWPHEDRVTSSDPSPLYTCWFGKAIAHLEADGKLYPCGMGVGRMPGLDVLSMGFSRAWKALEPLPNCRSCTMACGVEANLLFSLNWRVILNWIKQLRD